MKRTTPAKRKGSEQSGPASRRREPERSDIATNEPPFQTLDEILQYELAKRSSHEGIALAAMSGDRDAIAAFAGLSMVCAESAIEFPDIRDVLVDVLDQIRAGVEPNDAFGWTRERQGHSGTRGTFARLLREWGLGRNVAHLVASGVSETAAIAQVSDLRHASKSTVRLAWLRWQGLIKTS